MDEDEESIAPDGSALFYAQAWNQPVKSNIKSLWDWFEPEEVPHRIAIVGAANTGKKRLARELASALDIPCIHSIPRTVKNLGYELNAKANSSTETMIWLAHLWEQAEYDEFVSASSLIEVCAYTHWLMMEGKIEDPHFMRALTNMTWMVAQNDYSVVFYLPYNPDMKIRRDNVRSGSHKFNNEIDELIRYYLDACEFDYLPLEGSPQRKIDICMTYMSDYGLLPND